jgi:hypothetical protein
MVALEHSDAFIRASDLKRQGWTESLIARFLGSPDRREDNPHARSGHKMRLYATWRVREAEALDEFVKSREDAARRSEAARLRIKTEQDVCMRIALAVPVSLDGVSIDEAVKVAKERVKQAVPMFMDIDNAFVDIATVLAMEERMDCFYDPLDDHFGRPGVKAAKAVIRRRIAMAICEKHPHLRKAVFDVLRGTI